MAYDDINCEKSLTKHTTNRGAQGAPQSPAASHDVSRNKTPHADKSALVGRITSSRHTGALEGRQSCAWSYLARSGLLSTYQHQHRYLVSLYCQCPESCGVPSRRVFPSTWYRPRFSPCVNVLPIQTFPLLHGLCLRADHSTSFVEIGPSRSHGGV